MREVFDVAVVGAGPAGSAAALRALQLRPEVRVLLLDTAGFPRDKTCGDGIAANVFTLLDSLDAPDLRGLGRPVPRLCIRSPSGRTVERTCARPNQVIPRTVFDAELLGAATARGAVLRRHRVRQLEVLRDRVVIDGTIEAGVVIGADGANSTVRRQLDAPPTPPSASALALRGYASTSIDPDALVLRFGSGRQLSYAWSFPLPEGGANVGFGVFDLRHACSRQQLLDGLHELLPDHEPDPQTVRGHHLPLSTGPQHHPDGRVLLAGDAAALVNPFSGEGIHHAMVSGVLAGEAALLGGGAGAAHRRAMRRSFARTQRHAAGAAKLLPRPRLLDAAVMAGARHQTVFDAAVELGLAHGTAPLHALVRVAAAYVRLTRR